MVFATAPMWTKLMIMMITY